MSIKDETSYSTIILCPICGVKHRKDYLEITSFIHHTENNECKEHWSLHVYCNYSDKGMTLYHGSEKPYNPFPFEEHTSGGIDLGMYCPKEEEDEEP